MFLESLYIPTYYTIGFYRLLYEIEESIMEISTDIKNGEILQTVILKLLFLPVCKLVLNYPAIYILAHLSLLENSRSLLFPIFVDLDRQQVFFLFEKEST